MAALEAVPQSPLKIVIIGDGAVGKTACCTRFTTNEFPRVYVPTVFDNTECHVTLADGRECIVTLWDTAGQEDYAHLRSLSFPGVSCFVICFSCTRLTSFENVSNVWLPEARQAEHGRVPVVLARTKVDLRGRRGSDVVTHEMGAELAREHGVGFVSTSALTGEGVDALFHEAARAALDHRARLAGLKKESSLRRVLSSMGLLQRRRSPRTAAPK